MIQFTTLFHLALNILIIACSLVLWFLFSDLLTAIFSHFGVLGEYESAPLLISGVIPLVFMVAVGYTCWPFLEALAAYCYIRTDLKTTVSLPKQEKYSFTSDSNGKWYRLDEVSELPKEKRREYLLEATQSRAKHVVVHFPNHKTEIKSATEKIEPLERETR